MHDYLYVAILSGLAGMLGWGFADFFAKKTIDEVGDLLSLTWAHVCGLVAIGSLVLVRAIGDGGVKGMPTTLHDYGGLAFFGVLQAAVYYFAYKAFSKGKVSLLNPVFSSYSGFVVLLSVLLFGELLGGWQLASLLVVFAGIFAISLDPEALTLKKLRVAKLAGMQEIAVATAGAAIWTVLWGHFVSNKDWLVYAAFMYLFMTIAIVVAGLATKIKFKVADRKLWKYFVGIGLAEVVAYAGVSIGYSRTSHVSVVAVLSAAFSVPTLILAYMFLKERITRIQTAGVLAVIAGVVLLALA